LFTKSKVEGYEVTIEVEYKTSDFFLFVLSEVFKAKKIKIRKKNHSRFCKISEFAYDRITGSLSVCVSF